MIKRERTPKRDGKEEGINGQHERGGRDPLRWAWRYYITAVLSLSLSSFIYFLFLLCC